VTKSTTPPPVPLDPEVVNHVEIRLIKERLQQGAGTMAGLKGAVEALAEQVRPKPVNYWAIAGKLFSIGVVIVGAAIAYGELRERVRVQGEQLGAVKDDVAEIRVQQTETAAAIRDIAAGQKQLADSLNRPAAEPSAPAYGKQGARRRR
jgi:hypothetical protein